MTDIDWGSFWARRSYVASDPICSKECGWDLGCYFKKYDVGCGGSTIPGITRYQGGKDIKGARGGEDKNPTTGCDTSDTLCNLGAGFTKWTEGTGKWMLIGGGAIGIVVLILILRRR